jgi:hypothetical protein
MIQQMKEVDSDCDRAIPALETNLPFLDPTSSERGRMRSTGLDVMPFAIWLCKKVKQIKNVIVKEFEVTASGGQPVTLFVFVLLPLATVKRED